MDFVSLLATPPSPGDAQREFVFFHLIVGLDDLQAQTRQVMTNLNHALAELGAGWDDVVHATVYTTKPTEYETIGRAMADGMGEAEPPAQVIAGVTSLALSELLIEIELVVSLP